jgi:peptidoglycan/xylan/chitin deacetylase (PgdA/CDA1 family)
VAERARLCALSVDLDEIRHYHAIHALTPAAPAADHAVYDRAVARFLDLASAERVPLTLFVVGADLARPQNAEVLRRAVDGGHELGNHTLDHLYDLSRREPAEVDRQISAANDAIAAHTGQRPTGFRAPGYVVNDGVYRALAAAGMAYSSSVFPCPLYYAAKAAVIGGLYAFGRSSSSIVHHPGVLSAPTAPYRVGTPYYRRGTGLLELPIQVTPRLRLPVYGTVVSWLGPALAPRLLDGLVGRELINLELHGVDLLDSDDGLAELGQRQRDLRLPLERKWGALTASIARLRRAGYSFVRLDEAARHFAARA